MFIKAFKIIVYLTTIGKTMQTNANSCVYHVIQLIVVDCQNLGKDTVFFKLPYPNWSFNQSQWEIKIDLPSDLPRR